LRARVVIFVDIGQLESLPEVLLRDHICPPIQSQVQPNTRGVPHFELLQTEHLGVDVTWCCFFLFRDAASACCSAVIRAGSDPGFRAEPCLDPHAILAVPFWCHKTAHKFRWDRGRLAIFARIGAADNRLILLCNQGFGPGMKALDILCNRIQKFKHFRVLALKATLFRRKWHWLHRGCLRRRASNLKPTELFAIAIVRPNPKDRQF